MTSEVNKLIKLAKDKYTQTNKNCVFILGDHSTQHFSRVLQGTLIKCNTNLEVLEADYNQIDICINSDESPLYSNDVKYIVLFETLQKHNKQFCMLNNQERSSFAEKTIERYEAYIKTISNKLNSPIFILNTILEIGDFVHGNYASKIKTSFLFQIKLFNFKLYELSQKHHNIFINDINISALKLGIDNIISNKFYINADLAFSLDALPIISNNITSIINANEGKVKKCVILDLDNTLWGGIIGDDGIENIEIGDLGIGKAFTELQKWLLELKKRGIILCVCSKNEDTIAREPFEKHPEMVLKIDDFAVFVANWKNKADNIRFIQKILNIGFDSMVFLDDNPFERNQVKQEIPEIIVPDLPEDPVNYLSYLGKLNLFDTASLSSIDKDRTKQYQEESKRVENKVSFSSIDDYLKSLKMNAVIKSFDNFNKARIAQLTQRSNQFNLRTIRYNEADIEAIMSQEDTYTLYVKLNDKFGDYGLISLVILKKRNDELFIDTWIMSCRVLKRGVEKLVLNSIIDIAKKENIKKITGEYIPTKKNILVKDLFNELGFKKKESWWYIETDEKNKKDHYINNNIK